MSTPRYGIRSACPPAVTMPSMTPYEVGPGSSSGSTTADEEDISVGAVGAVGTVFPSHPHEIPAMSNARGIAALRINRLRVHATFVTKNRATARCGRPRACDLFRT